MDKEHSHHLHASEIDATESQLKDPVCGMTVTADAEFSTSTCWVLNIDSAVRSASLSLSPLRRSTYPALPRTMRLSILMPGTHAQCIPKFRQKGPGTCPKCGMALEPEAPSLEEEENPELIDFQRRFLVDSSPDPCGCLCSPCFGHGREWVPMAWQNWVRVVC